MNFVDAVPATSLRRTEDGRLVADARVARTGVQVYRGAEVGKPERDVVCILRPEAEVFARAAMKGYAHRPVTVGHPATPVTADNWRAEAVGYIGEDVVRDGDYVRVPMIVADAAAVAAIEGGLRELSAGYTTDLDWTAGVTDAGEPYDAIQRNIRINHIAVVARGRAGPEARLGDEAGDHAPWGATPLFSTHATDEEPDMPDTLRTVVVDGLSVSTTDQGAQAITKLMDTIRAKDAALGEATATHDQALAQRDARIADLEAKALTDAALDARVEARAALVAKARTIADGVATSGRSDADIRRAVVAHRLGEDVVKDRSDAYVEGRFEALADASPAPTLSDALRERKPLAANDGWDDAARAAKLTMKGA